MVVKIQPPFKDTGNAVRYNESKVSADTAAYESGEQTGAVLATRNVPEGSTLLGEIERLRTLNERTSNGRRLQKPTFHMSINPGPADAPLTDAAAVEMTDRLMETLGYGGCPYRIYRHNDIGRTHFHVVGSRIGQDGLKVNSAFENRRCMKAVKDMQEDYGYRYGKDGGKKEKSVTAGPEPVRERAEEKPAAIPTAENTADKGKNKAPAARKEGSTFVRPFSRSSETPIAEQFKLFHEETMKWRFSTLAQYGAIMERRFLTNVLVLDDGLHFKGLDRKGAKVTADIGEKEMGLDALNDATRRAAETDMSACRAQRNRLEEKARESASEATSWDDFKERMRQAGILTVMSWTKEGNAFGVTWLDRATRCAWKGSETDADLSWLQQTAAAKGWTIAPDPAFEGRRRRASKKGKSKMKAGAPKEEDRTSALHYDTREKTDRLEDRAGIGHNRRDNESAAHNRGELEYDERKYGVRL